MSAAAAGRGLLDARLFALAARRAASPLVLAWLGLLVALALATASHPESARAAAAESPLAPEVWLRGLTRQTVIAILASAWAPLVLARAAAIVPRWRRGEIAWLGTRAAGTRTIVVSTWAGTFVATLLQAALALWVVETALGSHERSLRAAGTLASPAESWLAGGRELRWTSDAPAGAGTRVRVELVLGLGPGATAEVELRARRGGGEAASARARIGTRGAVEVEAPPGPGKLELALAASDPATRFFLPPRGVRAWIPCADERLASVSFLARAALAIVAWTALAIGFGAFVSAPTAVALILALSLPAWSAAGTSGLSPGGGLLEALATIGLGRVPGPATALELAAAVLATAAGLSLGALGLAGSRGSR